MAGRGSRSLMADCAQSRTQALQCQHSSGYLTNGETPFPVALKTCVGQMSAQVPQALHFFLSRIGGIFYLPPFITCFATGCAEGRGKIASARKTAALGSIGTKNGILAIRLMFLLFIFLARRAIFHLPSRTSVRRSSVSRAAERVVESNSFVCIASTGSLHSPGKPERKFREDHHQGGCHENGHD